jgi:hypothetical protein
MIVPSSLLGYHEAGGNLAQIESTEAADLHKHRSNCSG